MWHKRQQRGHLNNMWHFFFFLALSDHLVTFFYFSITEFKLNLLCNTKWIRKKYPVEPEISVKKLLTSKSLKTVFKKVKKYVWHIVDPPPLECHVLFKWPIRLFRSHHWDLRSNFQLILCWGNVSIIRNDREYYLRFY